MIESESGCSPGGCCRVRVPYVPAPALALAPVPLCAVALTPTLPLPLAPSLLPSHSFSFSFLPSPSPSLSFPFGWRYIWVADLVCGLARGPCVLRGVGEGGREGSGDWAVKRLLTWRVLSRSRALCHSRSRPGCCARPYTPTSPTPTTI